MLILVVAASKCWRVQYEVPVLKQTKQYSTCMYVWCLNQHKLNSHSHGSTQWCTCKYFLVHMHANPCTAYMCYDIFSMCIHTTVILHSTDLLYCFVSRLELHIELFSILKLLLYESCAYTVGTGIHVHTCVCLHVDSWWWQHACMYITFWWMCSVYLYSTSTMCGTLCIKINIMCSLVHLDHRIGSYHAPILCEWYNVCACTSV